MKIQGAKKRFHLGGVRDNFNNERTEGARNAGVLSPGIILTKVL